MESNAAIIVSIAGVGVSIVGVGVALAALIINTSGRIGTRLTNVERETARLAGLLEGFGLTDRAPGERQSGPAE